MRRLLFLFALAAASAILASCPEPFGAYDNPKDPDSPNFKDSTKALLSFYFVSPAATGTLDETNKTVSITVPYGTGVNALTPHFTVQGKSVTMVGQIRQSGGSSLDFSTSVNLIVTAEDLSTVEYLVTVTIAPNTAKAITAFSIMSPATAGVIDETAKTITVAVKPYSTDVKSLAASFNTTGASVSIGPTVQTSGATTNDYTNPLVYTVTAADGSTTNYTVTVTPTLTWTHQIGAGTHNWTSIASSDDGMKLVACATDDLIYTSIDSGVNWTPQASAGIRKWTSIASSSDGTKIAACVENGYIFSSTDSGSNWIQCPDVPNSNWRSICSSSDGMKLAACRSSNMINGDIYYSTDGGSTWTMSQYAARVPYVSIASSTDGTNLLACSSNNGSIYISNDSGYSWTARASAGNKEWKMVASSADGRRLAACGDYHLFISGNWGSTWSEAQSSTSPISGIFLSISKDGKRLCTAMWADINFTMDFGQTWNRSSCFPNTLDFTAIASSSDGLKYIAAHGGRIYSGQ